jgi:hypothetical protein
VKFGGEHAIEWVAGEARRIGEFVVVLGAAGERAARDFEAFARGAPRFVDRDGGQPAEAALVERDVWAADEREPRERARVSDGLGVDGAGAAVAGAFEVALVGVEERRERLTALALKLAGGHRPVSGSAGARTAGSPRSRLSAM